VSAVCPSCQHEVADDARFCSHCGSRLAQTRAAPEVAERRQLTVMFCDLVGFTEITERLDPEDLSEIIRDYQAAVRAGVERYGGFVARTFGDGVMAYFCYPRAHEDDAERAVRSGLDIAAEVPGLHAVHALAVRVGIATGNVVVGDLIGEGASSEREVMGVTPNLAARLQGLAEPGSVVISPRTKKLISASFRYSDLGARQVKGIAEPVRAWRVLGAGQRSLRDEEGLTALMGRSHELGQMRERWADAEQGEGGAVLLVAEAGMGKSRLLRAFLDGLEEQPHHRTLIAASPYHRQSPRHPLAVGLRRDLGIEDSATPEVAALQRRLRELDLDPLESGAPLAMLLGIPPDPTWPPFDIQSGDAQLRNTLDAYHQAAAGDLPLVYVVEDLHWLDPSSRAFLDHVVSRAERRHALVVVTSRPFDEMNPWSSATHLRLSRLRQRDAREMLTQLGITDADQVAQIIQRADGVPLYLEEVSKSVLAGVTGAGVPASLEDSLRARLDALGSSRSLAQLASVIGRTFSYGLLERVVEAGTLSAGLEELVSSGMVMEREPRVLYEFKHALIRDAAYGSLLRRTRHELHGRIARALEAHFPDIATREPDQLAQHFRAATLDEEASTYFKRAGDLATARSANNEGAGHYRAALDCLDRVTSGGDRGQRLALLTALCARLRVLNLQDEATRRLDEAEGLARDLDDAPALGSVLVTRGRINFASGQPDASQAAFEGALEVARAADLPRVEAQAYGGLADAKYVGGLFTSSGVLYQQCVDACGDDPALADIRASHRASITVCLYYEGQLGESIRQGHLALEESTASGTVRGQMISHGTGLGVAQMEIGDCAASAAAFERASAIAAQLGSLTWVGSMDIQRSLALYRAGHPDAVDAAVRAMEVVRGHAMVFAGAWGMGVMGLVSPDRATRESMRETGYDEAVRAGIRHNAVWFHRLAIEGCQADGDLVGMRRNADALLRWEAEYEYVYWAAFYGQLGAAVADHAEGDDSARDRLGALRRDAAERQMVWAVAQIDRALG